jgi:hypothetical protein
MRLTSSTFSYKLGYNVKIEIQEIIMFKFAIRHLITLTLVVFLLGGCAKLVGTSILTAGIAVTASKERDEKKNVTDNKSQKVSQPLSEITSNHISGNSNASDLSEITSNHISGNSNASDLPEITSNHISGNSNASDLSEVTSNRISGNSNASDLSEVTSNHISGNSNASDLSEITSNHISGNSNSSDLSEITSNHISRNSNASDLSEITSNHISGNSNASYLSEVMSNHISGNSNASDFSKVTSNHISGNGFQNKPEGSSSQSYSHREKKEYGYKIISDISVYTRKCPFTQLLKFKVKLGLTDLQVKEIKKLRFEFQKQSILNEAEHEIAHMELDRLVHADSVDAEAIHSVTGKIVALKAKMIMTTAEAKIILLGLLTEEQRKKA